MKIFWVLKKLRDFGYYHTGAGFRGVPKLEVLEMYKKIIFYLSIYLTLTGGFGSRFIQKKCDAFYTQHFFCWDVERVRDVLVLYKAFQVIEEYSLVKSEVGRFLATSLVIENLIPLVTFSFNI
jgi:hypothetical protein